MENLGRVKQNYLISSTGSNIKGTGGGTGTGTGGNHSDQSASATNAHPALPYRQGEESNPKGEGIPDAANATTLTKNEESGCSTTPSPNPSPSPSPGTGGKEEKKSPRERKVKESKKYTNSSGTEEKKTKKRKKERKEKEKHSPGRQGREGEGEEGERTDVDKNTSEIQKKEEKKEERENRRKKGSQIRTKTKEKEEKHQETRVNRRESCPVVDLTIAGSEKDSPKPQNEKKKKNKIFKKFASFIQPKKKKNATKNEEEILKNLEKIETIELEWEGGSGEGEGAGNSKNILFNSISKEFNYQKIMCYQKIQQTGKYSIFLISDESRTNFYFMISVELDKIIKINKLKKIKNRFISELKFIFYFGENLFFLFDFCYFPFLNFIEKKATHSLTHVYLGELLVSLEFIQASEIEFTFTPERIFVDHEGHIQLLTMFDLPRSEKGISADANQNLQVNSILFISPELLKGGTKSSSDLWWSFSIFAYFMLTGSFPFPLNSHSILQALMNQDFRFHFPPFLNDLSRDLLEKLLDLNYESRLKSPDLIKKHPFFQSIDWIKLKSGGYPVCLPDASTCFINPPPPPPAQASTPSPAIPSTPSLTTFPGSAPLNGDSPPNSQNYPTRSLLFQEMTFSVADGQPLDTLIAPAFKNDLAGFTLCQANIEDSFRSKS